MHGCINYQLKIKMECLEKRSKMFTETEKVCEQNGMVLVAKQKQQKRRGGKWHICQHIGLSLHCHYVESQLSFINAVLFIIHVRYK